MGLQVLAVLWGGSWQVGCGGGAGWLFAYL